LSEIKMPDCGCFHADRLVSQDADLAASIVMRAYVQLPLLPRQPDGCWMASLKRCGERELRLVESVPASPGQPVLRVELFDRTMQTAIEARDCEEIEDAVVAFQDMVSRAT
jgi:hypothetical protein